MKKTFFIVFHCIAAIASTDCIACDCPILSTQEKFCDAHSVVIAKIHSTWNESETTSSLGDDLEGDFRADWPFHQGGALLAHYELLESLKGNSTKRGLVFTSRQPASCGVELQKDGLYLMFIGSYGSVYVCDGSRSLNKSSSDNEIVELRNIAEAYAKNARSVCSPRNRTK